MSFFSRVKLISIFSILILCVLSFALFAFLKSTTRSPYPTTRLVPPSTTASIPLPAKCGNWSVIPDVHPNPGGTEQLLGVAAISPADIWAVGHYVSSIGLTSGLIEHWNGSAWNVLSHPKPGSDSTSEHFNAVVGSSTRDVWLVGDYTYRGASQRTLIEHWNGSTWSIVVSPNVGSNWNELSAITAISPTDVWAVGTFSDGADPLRTLIEHWDGAGWSVVISPNIGLSDNNLLSVAAASPHDIWAVGRYFSLSRSSTQTLVEHWDGTRWSIVASPNSGHRSSFEGIAVASPQDVWAVGSYENASNSLSKTLIEHWNGTTWKTMPGPDIQTNTDTLIGIAAVSSTNIWAVGATESAESQKVLIEHWDGARWSIIPDTNPLATSEILRAVARVPGTSYVWAVGILSNTSFTTFYC